MIEGRCLCGNVGYTYSGQIEEVAYCHCSQCRKAQGAAFAINSPVDAEKVTFFGKQYIKEYQSNHEKVRAFCTNCGSPIYSAKRSLPGVYRLRLGLTTTSFVCENRYHIFTESKADWHSIIDDYPQFEKNKG